MLIYVKTLTGRKVEFELTDEMTFGSLKERISEKEGIDLLQIRLIYSGNLHNDAVRLIDTKIAAGAIIHMVLSLRGG